MSTAVAVVVAMLVLSVCMFMPAPVPQSEARAEAEAESLGLVPRSRLHGQRIIYTDRAERRYPLHTQAGTDTHHGRVQNIELGSAECRTPQRAYIYECLAR